MDSKNKQTHSVISSLQLVVSILVVSGLIACILYLLQIKEAPFTTYFIFAESVGLCQGLCIVLMGLVFADKKCSPAGFFVQSFIGLLLGSVAGIQLGVLLTGGKWLLSFTGLGDIIDSIGLAVIFGGLIVSGYAVRTRIIIGSESRSERVRRKLEGFWAWRSFILTALLNTLIAGMLYGLGFKDATFGEIFIVSQSIGLSCCLCVYAGFFLFGSYHPLIPSVGGVAVGAVIGPLIGSILVGKAELILNRDIGAYSRAILIGFIFGLLGTAFFYIRSQLADARAGAEQEKAKTLLAQRDVAETSLRLLQAQIEPHFLFNTLSNVISLLNNDVDTARKMLVDLTSYLRTSLVRTRTENTTLGQEIEMINAYLDIFQIRMGDRLTYSIELPDSLRNVAYPSMLLQPLVENSLKHGIEPLVGGGMVRVSADLRGDRLTLEVADTGMGMTGQMKSTQSFAKGAGGMGVGFKNVRARLETLYAGMASFRLEENEPQGVRAIIETPVDHTFTAKSSLDNDKNHTGRHHR